MFSNSTEYELFLETYCYNCKNYKDWEKEEPCPIEDKMALAVFNENEFPKNEIVRDKTWFICKKFEKKR